VILYLGVNLAAALLLLAGSLWGPVLLVFQNDGTGMSWGIAAWGVLATLLVPLEKWRFIDYSRTFLVFLGLIGTVVGFMIALSGVPMEAASTPEAANATVKALLSGLGTALGTTLVGAVSSLWLGINKMLFCGE